MFAFRITSSKVETRTDVPSTNKNGNISYFYILSHNVFSYDEYNKIENDINISFSYQWKWKHWHHPDPDFRLFYLGSDFVSAIMSQFTFRLGSLFSFFNIINFASFKWTAKSNVLHLRQYDDAFQLSLTPLPPARTWKLV